MQARRRVAGVRCGGGSMTGDGADYRGYQTTMRRTATHARRGTDRVRAATRARRPTTRAAGSIRTTAETRTASRRSGATLRRRASDGTIEVRVHNAIVRDNIHLLYMFMNVGSRPPCQQPAACQYCMRRTARDHVWLHTYVDGCDLN